MSEIRERKETGRIEIFSDGVFAIAITLLVLGIDVPKASVLGSDGSLSSALVQLWPHYLAFVTSFATILAMWVNHHRIFTFVLKSDHFFLYWNGLLLMIVTFMPFPTTVLAEYFLHPEAKVAGALFAGTLFAIALVFKGLWHCIKERKAPCGGSRPGGCRSNHTSVQVRAADVLSGIRDLFPIRQFERRDLPVPGSVFWRQGLADSAMTYLDSSRQLTARSFPWIFCLKPLPDKRRICTPSWRERR